MNSGFGDDRAAITVAYEDRGTVLKVEDPFRCRDVVGERGFWLLQT
jgi:hypothetical protein